uniref:hypothetical protein n=1 Tax=Alistipes sp. TaxID=1872444 RepID=UPI004056852D
MKIFRFFGVAFIAIILSVNITSCNKDGEGSIGNNNPTGDKRITKLVKNYSSGYSSTTTFVYDDQGRVIESQQDGDVCTYIWGNNIIQQEYKMQMPAGVERTICKIFTIKNGLVQKEDIDDGYMNSTITYNYDSMGRWNDDMIWDGDKLVLEYSGDCKYEYNYIGQTCKKGFRPNFNTDELFIIHPELVGIQTTQLQASATRTITGGPSSGEKNTETYEYEFDNDGCITKVTEKGQDYTYTYTLTWE